MVKSILQANTIELHYWMDDNSHIIDANIQNKCERELLDMLDSIAGQWGFSVTVETMPLANGGVIRWFRLKAKSFKKALKGKEKTIYIAIVTTLATTIIATPITTSIESIVQQTIENIFADEEVRQMQKENLRLDIEIKQEMLRQIQLQDKLEKKRSNFYEQLNQEPNVTQISVNAQDENFIPIIPELIVQKTNFPSYIITSSNLPSEIIDGAIIEIISPVLKKGDYKWRGIYNGETVAFNMKSNEFKTLVQTGTIEFTNGSSIKCLLEIKKNIDSNGDEKITEYNIVRVDEYFKNEKPIETPEGKKNRQKQEADRMQGKLF